MIDKVVLKNDLSPGNNYAGVTNAAVLFGLTLGEKKFGAASFAKKRFPSETKIRIIETPYVDKSVLYVGVTPFEWSDLVSYRQIMPCGKTGWDFTGEESLLRNSLTLTANAVLRTSDDQLFFHVKKGGAKEGSIHTFGGYVSPEDLSGENPIEVALRRELMEKSELGLREEDFGKLGPYFGEEGDMPSALWNFGTAAVYGVVEVNKSTEELARGVGDETLEGKVFSIPIKEVSKLTEMKNIHPQTAQSLPFLVDVVNQVK
jgi:hypothetical protein